MNCIDRPVVLKILAKFNIFPGEKDEELLLECEKIVHEYGDDIEEVITKDYEDKILSQNNDYAELEKDKNCILLNYYEQSKKVKELIWQIEDLQDELTDLKFSD